MNNQKNRFWTFCLSLIPGAGEMYFGLYREGVSLMLLFILLFALPLTLEMGAFALLSVIVWFYSFLHTHNLRAMPLDEFCQLDDHYFWEGIDLNFRWDNKYRNIVAIALIVIGAFLLWDNLFSWIGYWLPGFFRSLIYRLPRVIIGLLIIVLGLRLISGKKREMEQEVQEQPQTTTYAEIPPMPVYRSEFGAEAPHAPDVTASETADAPASPETPDGEVNQKEGDGHADA